MNAETGSAAPTAATASPSSRQLRRRSTISLIRSLAARPAGAACLATAAYAAYAVFLTWPLATNPGGLLSGSAISGDLGGSVSQVAYVVQHHVFPFAPATFHDLNAPFGVSQSWVEGWASLPGNVLLFGLGYAFGAVGGSNVFLWLSFVLSGLSMFLLTRRLFGSFGAALAAGFAFAFYPFAVDKIAGHYQYMDGWVLVLGVWRMLELVERPTVRNALLGGAAAAFGMWWTPYFMLIGGVSFAVMEFVLLAMGLARRRLWPNARLAIVAALPIAILFGSLGALAVVAGGAETGAVRTQSIDQLYTYSARWLEWVLPDRNNIIFGGATSNYLISHLHGSNFSESSLYLGISVIVLALVGSVLAGARVGRWRSQGPPELPAIAALSGALLALVAAWFSAPPTVQIFGVSVPTPSDVIFKFTSTFRVYTRFVELVELGLCIPLAYAVARLQHGRGRVMSAGLAAVILGILVLDLWARPPVRTVNIATPPEYVWLRDHPRGTVADWPVELAAYPDYTALFWQSAYDHPLFQGYDSGSEAESMKVDMSDLREPTTAHYLADLGVRYVVVHPGDVGADQQTLSTHQYVVRFASAVGSVWQVVAQPAKTRVDDLENFSTLEGNPGDEYRWMVGPGVLGVYARDCALSCRGDVTFQSSSNSVPRVLTVRDQRTGRVLTRATIPVGRAVAVRVPSVILRGGRARLALSTNIPAELPAAGVDPRLLSITVGEARFHVR